LSYAPAREWEAKRCAGKRQAALQGEITQKNSKFGQQTPRRWGWGTPLKKRTATRIASMLLLSNFLSISLMCNFCCWTLHLLALRRQFSTKGTSRAVFRGRYRQVGETRVAARGGLGQPKYGTRIARPSERLLTGRGRTESHRNSCRCSDSPRNAWRSGHSWRGNSTNRRATPGWFPMSVRAGSFHS